MKSTTAAVRIGVTISSALLICAATLDLDSQGLAAPRAEKRTAAQTAANTPEGTSERPVKLFYLQTRWPKVLEDVAQATGTTLVADRMPTRPYTRMDRRSYTAAEALRILNHELEPNGLRLLIRGQHLILIDVPATRKEYARPNASAAPRSSDASDGPANSGNSGDNSLADLSMETTTITDSEPASDDSVAPAEFVELSARKTNTARSIRQLSGTRPANSAPRALAATTQVEVALRHQQAVSVARMMYTAYGKRAELIRRGPGGLPAFRVYRDKQASDVQFSVAIDEDENLLLVEATEPESASVARLIESLDTSRGKAGSSIRAVATSKDAARIARQLQPQLRRLATQARRHPFAETDSRTSQFAAADLDDGQFADESMDDEQAEEEPEQPQPAPRDDTRPAPRKGEPGQPGEEQPDLPALLGGLKGEVSVEASPDLGILILRGNQKDVDAVMEIIKEIERLSVGAAPDVHLLLLEHVNSEGLAGLLTTVYDRLRGARAATVQQAQSVSILPIARPNAILILASAADMESVLKLAEELDQATDPRTEAQVFKLRSAVATQVAETVQQLYPDVQTGGPQQQQTAAGLLPRIRIAVDVRTNSVIVQAQPRDMAEAARLIRRLDTSEMKSVSQLRIFPLKSATADEVGLTLQTAIQSILNPQRVTSSVGGGQFGGAGGEVGGAGASPELRAVKSTVLQFLALDGERQRVLRSGILADIRVTTDARTNSLVVAAPEESMPLMEELIRQLDRPAATVAEIKVFSLARGDATLMTQLLERLFNTQAAQAGRAGAGAGVPGVQVAGADDASSTLIPLRFSVDVRTNSIIAIGGAEALRVVEAVLLRLDESDIRQRESTVYRLKNSFAPDVAAAINQFLTSRREVETTEPGLVSPFEQIEREVVVVPETATNSLLISSTPRYFDEIRSIVDKLDAAPSQVVIQALLVEVTLDNTDEFGVELGFQDSVLFNRSIVSNIVQVPITTTAPNGVQTTTQQIISRQLQPGFNFNNQPLGNNPISPGQVGKQSLTNFALGRINGDLGYGGLVLSAGSESVSVLLRALSAKRRVDILSRPQIRTLDNQLAQIQVGQQVPIVNGVNVTAVGSANPVVVQDQAGIILTVTPRITPEQMVVMEVIAEKSQFTGAGVPIFTDATSGNVIESPIKDLTTARTTVSVRDGQTIVLGGMITKTVDKFERKVPWIGDIPLVGTAFRYDFKSQRRTELLIFLTPRVIRNDADSELIKQVETDRIHFIEEDAEQMHGPILAVPATEYFLPEGTDPSLLPYPTMLDDEGTPTTVLPGVPSLTPTPSNGLPPQSPVAPRGIQPDRVAPPPPTQQMHMSAPGAGVSPISHETSQPPGKVYLEDIDPAVSQVHVKGKWKAASNHKLRSP